MPPSKTKSIADEARENPYRFFPVADVAELFGFGRHAMTAIINAGAPVVARKINPDHLKAWLRDNAEKVGKITD